MKVVLKSGESVQIEFEESDNGIEVHFDTPKHTEKLVVEADLPGNVTGAAGVIYEEDFSRGGFDSKDPGNLDDVPAALRPKPPPYVRTATAAQADLPEARLPGGPTRCTARSGCDAARWNDAASRWECEVHTPELVEESEQKKLDAYANETARAAEAGKE